MASKLSVSAPGWGNKARIYGMFKCYSVVVFCVFFVCFVLRIYVEISNQSLIRNIQELICHSYLIVYNKFTSKYV